MENLLREYMERGFSEAGSGNNTFPGPVVTISRESGCPSKLIGQMLTDVLNKYGSSRETVKWRFISKEVVEGAARQLELNTTEVDFLLNSGGKGVIEDIMTSFSQSYVSSHRIRKTVTTVVKSIAGQGKVVILGRGGAGILQNRPDTLHIRLQAPVEWRAREICKLRNITEKEALKCIEENDKKRTGFIEMLIGGNFYPHLFDVTFNCSTLSKEEIVHTIIGLMGIKKLI